MKQIIVFSIPLILCSLLQQLYNFADTMLVGRFLGLEALAGVGATGSLNFIIIGFCIGVCAGFSVPVAQMFGARDYKRLRKFVANAIYLSIFFSLVITICVALNCRKILIMMNTREEFFDYSYIYILTIIIGIPITFMYNLFAGVIRAVGDSKTPLIFLFISSIINIWLDYAFIVNLNMGIFGAALATVISQLMSGILCIIVLIKRFEVLHISKDEWKIDVPCMKTLSVIGIPMGLQYSITGIGSVILQSSVNSISDVAVAAVAASCKVNMVFISVIDGLGGAMATYGGQNLGAGKIDRIRKGTKEAFFIAVGYSVIALVVAIFVRVPMIKLFDSSSNAEMIDMAALHVLINLAGLFFLVLVDLLRFLIQGVGYSVLAICAGILEMIARIIAALVFIPQWGFIGSCISSPFAWILADMFLVPAYFIVIKKLENQQKQS